MAAILNFGHNIFSPGVTKCHPPDSVHRHAEVTKITIKRCIDPKTTFGKIKHSATGLNDCFIIWVISSKISLNVSLR